MKPINRRQFLQMMGMGAVAASTTTYFDMGKNLWRVRPVDPLSGLAMYPAMNMDAYIIMPKVRRCYNPIVISGLEVQQNRNPEEFKALIDARMWDHVW